MRPKITKLDVPDIALNGDGTVDAVTTLTQADGDGAAYGQPYGAFIGAPLTEAFGRYISGLVNDDSFESHRVELFPLPAWHSTQRQRHQGQPVYHDRGYDDPGSSSRGQIQHGGKMGGCIYR